MFFSVQNGLESSKWNTLTNDWERRKMKQRQSDGLRTLQNELFRLKKNKVKGTGCA